MSPLCRAVASVIRLVGCCLVGLAVVLFALAWFRPPPGWQLAGNAALAVGGILLLINSRSLAARLTDDEDETGTPDRGD
jgi:hypothetical protein